MRLCTCSGQRTIIRLEPHRLEPQPLVLRSSVIFVAHVSFHKPLQPSFLREVNEIIAVTRLKYTVQATLQFVHHKRGKKCFSQYLLSKDIEEALKDISY